MLRQTLVIFGNERMVPIENFQNKAATTSDGTDVLLAEKVTHLFNNSSVAASVNIGIAVLLYISLPALGSHWLWIIVAASAQRFGLYFWRRAKAEFPGSLLFQYRIAVASIAVQGAAWGISSVLLFGLLSESHRFYLIAVLAGMTGGSILTLAPSFAAFSAFVIPSICPLLAAFMIDGSVISRQLAIMGFIYVLAIHIVARRINLSAIEQIITRRKLEIANQQLSTYKNELEDLVSERTRELQLSEERYRDTFEKAVVGMAVLELDGRFIKTNPAFRKMLGYSEDELSRQTLLDVTSPDDRSLWSEHLQDAIAGGGSEVIQEIRYLKKSGEVVEVMVSFRAVKDEGGSPLHSIAQFLDITERKRIEREQQLFSEKLRQSQKMEAIGTLAGGIAHDFNNILSAIVGYTEIAKFKLVDHPKESAALDKILKAAKRAIKLVKQILVFSRKGEEKSERIRIDVVIEEALNLIRHTIPATTPIHVFLDPLTGTIQGDPTQIHQVVINLCTNAFHAVRDVGGEIEVRLEPVEVDEQRSHDKLDIVPGAYAQLTIKDTGTGMHPSTKSRIFEPFFTTKKLGEGTGMGLAVVYGIIQKHGGFIEVDSRPREGTTVRILLPLLSVEADHVTDTITTLQYGNEKVLFVDDETMLVSLGKMSLEILGYQVTATTSANEALEMFSSNPDDFDLVITDQTMPEMSGARLAQAIMQIRPDIPVVLCSGYSESINAEKARELGVKAFLQKPIDHNTMSGTIREILDSGQRQQ